MTDRFVKKQIYECSKCGRQFDSKDEVNEHFERIHEFADKYVNAYIISNDEKYIGKVLDTSLMKMNNLIIETIRFETRNSLFGETHTTFVGRKTISADDLERNFTIVSIDAIREYLEKKFVSIGYAQLRANDTIKKDFTELFTSDYREKGDDDGN